MSQTYCEQMQEGSGSVLNREESGQRWRQTVTSAKFCLFNVCTITEPELSNGLLFERNINFELHVFVKMSYDPKSKETWTTLLDDLIYAN